MEVGAIGRLSGDLEAWQREHADLLLNDLLARPVRQPLPRLFTLFFGFPHQAATLGHAIERVGMCERLWITAKHDADMPKIAIDANPFGSCHHEIGSWGALFFGSIFGIGADVNDFLGVAEIIDYLVALIEEIIQ